MPDFSTGPRTQALLDAIAADLRVQLPALKSCKTHDGRWDAGEVKRWAVQTPALVVAWLGTASTEQPGMRWTDAKQELAIYVLTSSGLRAGAPAPGSGGPKLAHGEAARNLVDWLLLYLPRARWGLAGLGNAEKIQAENLYSTALDQAGVSIAGVTWSQVLQLEAGDDGSIPFLPAKLYSSAQDDPHELIHAEDE